MWQIWWAIIPKYEKLIYYWILNYNKYSHPVRVNSWMIILNNKIHGKMWKRWTNVFTLSLSIYIRDAIKNFKFQVHFEFARKYSFFSSFVIWISDMWETNNNNINNNNNHHCQWNFYLIVQSEWHHQFLIKKKKKIFQCGVPNEFLGFFPHFIHFTKTLCKKYSLESVENFDVVSKVTEKVADHLSPANLFFSFTFNICT